MKISTKGRYALRLMLDLANNHQYGYTPVKEISLRQDISDKYLEQIISRLSKAGLVVSARGAQGGYKLAKEPEACTVGEILRVLECWRATLPRWRVRRRCIRQAARAWTTA